MAAETMARAVNRAAGLRVISRCSSRSEVAATCAACSPDVAVLDLALYDDDPGDAVDTLHKQARCARLLLMIDPFEDVQLARALMAGADNCLSACADAHSFVTAVRATAEGRSTLASDVQNRAVRLIVEMSELENRRLSPRECEVLRLLAAGVPLDEIASQLFITINTARTHLYRSYRKLGAHDRIGAIGLAMRRGLLR